MYPTLPPSAWRNARFPIRLLGCSDFNSVLRLRNEVLSQLKCPDLYVREVDEPLFIRSHMAGHEECAGDTIGVFDGEMLIAYAMLGLPPDDTTNLGQHVDLGGWSLKHVSHLASCMVLLPYRGRGLQRMLLTARFALAHAYGRPFCIAMTSLHNHASRRNLMRVGMRILRTGTIDGLERQLLALNLERRWLFHQADARLVACNDFESQVALTRGGWWGVSEIEGGRESDGSSSLVFARPIWPDVHVSPL